jgi:RNA polymerase sigma-70 factor (ECF subfamily)
MIDWETLLEQHGQMVFAVSWRILRNTSEVEDNVQDVFLQAFQLQQKQAIRHWGGLMRRLATLSALARLRRRKQDVSLDQVAPPIAREGTSEEHAIENEVAAMLRDAVAKLPPREGAVFWLRYIEQLTIDEIAESVGIKYQAAATALSRARSKLETVYLESLAEEK